MKHDLWCCMPYNVFIYETNTERECIKDLYYWGKVSGTFHLPKLLKDPNQFGILTTDRFNTFSSESPFWYKRLFHCQELCCFLKPSTALGLPQADTWLIAAITITQSVNRSCHMNSLHCGSSRISRKELAEKLQFTICSVISVSTLSSLKAALVRHCRIQKTLWGQHAWKRTPYSVTSSNCITEWKNVQLQLRLSLC